MTLAWFLVTAGVFSLAGLLLGFSLARIAGLDRESAIFDAGRDEALAEVSRLHRGVGYVPGYTKRGHPGAGSGHDRDHPSVRRERGAVETVEAWLIFGLVAGLILALPMLLGGVS